jgi:hypothetical protein
MFLAFVFLGTLAIPGASGQVQGVPVVLIGDAIQRSHISSSTELPEQPRPNPPKAFLSARVNPYSILTAGVYVAVWMDMTRTESEMPHFKEQDPLAKPLLLLPKPLYFLSGTLTATGVNWLGGKMRESQRWHKIWWLPQAISAAGNMSGYGYTRANASPSEASLRRSKAK